MDNNHNKVIGMSIIKGSQAGLSKIYGQKGILVFEGLGFLLAISTC